VERGAAKERARDERILKSAAQIVKLEFKMNRERTATPDPLPVHGE
jgi:hypothetical protein